MNSTTVTSFNWMKDPNYASTVSSNESVASFDTLDSVSFSSEGFSENAMINSVEGESVSVSIGEYSSVFAMPASLAINYFNSSTAEEENASIKEGVGLSGHSQQYNAQSELDNVHATNATLIESGLIIGGALIGDIPGLAIGAVGAAVYDALSSPDIAQVPTDTGSTIPATQDIL